MPELRDGKLSCAVLRGRKLPEVGLAQNNRILYIEMVSLGSVKATTVEPMNVFRWAVMKGVVSVIMCHNHPSGVRPNGALNQWLMAA